jgi:hypothetical protein
MDLTITANGTYTAEIGAGKRFIAGFSGTFDSASIDLKYQTAAAVAAALTTSLTGTHNDLVFTARNAGTGGNSLTVAYIDPAESDSPISVTFDGTDLVVNLATDSGDAATVNLASTGANNDITVTADAAGSAGNSYSVEFIDPSANNATLSVTTADYLKFTVNLATGAGGAITSTAAQVIAALNAYAPFAALMTAANTGGNNGSGVVTAIAETDLTGGGDNYAITTTAAEIATAVSLTTANDKISVANAAANDGTGVVTALAETALSGGTQGTFASLLTSAITAANVSERVSPSNRVAVVVTSAGGSASVRAILTQIAI